MMSLRSYALASEWLQGVNYYLWISWRSQTKHRKIYKISQSQLLPVVKILHEKFIDKFHEQTKKKEKKSFSLCCAILSAFYCANFGIRFGSINSINVLKRKKKNIRTLPSAHELLSANLWRVAFIFHRFRSEVFLPSPCTFQTFCFQIMTKKKEEK